MLAATVRLTTLRMACSGVTVFVDLYTDHMSHLMLILMYAKDVTDIN